MKSDHINPDATNKAPASGTKSRGFTREQMKLYNRVLVNSKTGIPTELYGEALITASKKGTVISRGNYYARRSKNKEIYNVRINYKNTTKTQFLNTSDGSPAHLRDEALATALREGTVINSWEYVRKATENKRVRNKRVLNCHPIEEEKIESKSQPIHEADTSDNATNINKKQKLAEMEEVKPLPSKPLLTQSPVRLIFNSNINKHGIFSNTGIFSMGLSCSRSLFEFKK